MTLSFATEPEFEAQLEWVRTFVRDEVYPLEALDLPESQLRPYLSPLVAQVKARGLWAAQLPPDLGGSGFGQVELALIHEIVGASPFIGPQVFGSQAPDSGNVELLAMAGSPEQKRRWMEPLLAGEIRSVFSMTEPGAGADPTLATTRAVLDGDEWVIDGHKWYTSNGSTADFLIVFCLTDPDADTRSRFSMLLVPADTTGVRIVRDIPDMLHPHVEEPGYASESEVRYEGVRVPVDALVGGRGQAFALAQARLGPGRVHHCMRWLGQCRRAYDMLCERAVSRFTHGSYLSEKQTVQNWVADSYADIHAARLAVLHTAWMIDTVGASAARTEIAMIKFHVAQVLHRVIDRAVQVHGSLGYSADLPLELMYRLARSARIYDGPDEVHRVTVARRELKRYRPVDVPTEHLPTRRRAAMVRYGLRPDDDAGAGAPRRADGAG